MLLDYAVWFSNFFHPVKGYWELHNEKKFQLYCLRIFLTTECTSERSYSYWSKFSGLLADLTKGEKSFTTNKQKGGKKSVEGTKQNDRASGKTTKEKHLQEDQRSSFQNLVGQPIWTPGVLNKAPRIRQPSFKDKSQQSGPAIDLSGSEPSFPVSGPAQCTWVIWMESAHRYVSFPHYYVVQCEKSLVVSHISQSDAFFVFFLLSFTSCFIVSKWIFVSHLVFVHYQCRITVKPSMNSIVQDLLPEHCMSFFLMAVSPHCVQVGRQTCRCLNMPHRHGCSPRICDSADFTDRALCSQRTLKICIISN